MGLKKSQIKNVAKKILTEKLKAGIMPDEENIRNLILEYFHNKNFLPGQPSFTLKEALRRGSTDNDDYNEMLNLIEEDLKLLYENILSQNEKIINSFNYFQSEKDYVKNKISKLTTQTEEIINKINNTNPYVDSHVERFTDFNKIDLNKTNAFIDLDNNEVSLPNQIYLSQNVNLKESHIQLMDAYPSQEIKERRSLSSINNAIDGTLNNVWQYEIVLAESNNKQEMNVEFEITFKEEKEFSRLQMSPSSLGKTYLTVYYEDDNEWKTLGNIQNFPFKKLSTWSFTNVKTNKLKFKLNKDNPDRNNKEYLFGVANILVFKNIFKEKASLETEAFEVGQNINNFILDKISLDVEDEIPEGCDIDYYIQYGSDKDNLSGKIKIEPNRENDRENAKGDIINLENTSQIRRHITSECLEKAERFSLPHSDFYESNDILEHAAIQETIRVYRGDKFWLKETYQDVTQDSDEKAVSMRDWTGIPSNANVVKEIINDEEIAGREGYNIEKIYEIARPSKDRKTFYISCVSLDNENIRELSVLEEKNGEENEIEEEEIELNLEEGIIRFEEPIEGDLKVSYKAPRVFYKFSTWIYMDEENTYRTASMNYPSEPTLHPELRKKGYYTSIFLNNAQVHKRTNRINSDQYQYVVSLQKGWNHITMIAYKHNDDIDVHFGAINALNLGSTNLRFIREPMHKIKLYNLRHKTIPTDKNNFAIDSRTIDQTTRSMLIFNNKDRNNYLIEYKYPNEDNFNKSYYLKVSAELKTQDKFITPKIKKIEANVSF